MSLKGRPTDPSFSDFSHFHHYKHILLPSTRSIETSRGLCCESAMKYFQLHFRISRLQDRDCGAINHLSTKCAPRYMKITWRWAWHSCTHGGFCLSENALSTPVKVVDCWPTGSCTMAAPAGRLKLLKTGFITMAPGVELCRGNIFEFRSTTSRTVTPRINKRRVIASERAATSQKAD